MPINLSGSLLEGIRISSGNNAYTFPPRSLISDQAALNATARAEYLLITDLVNQNSAEIADPNLRFNWVKNDSAIRFEYDSFSNRWLPSPGSAPLEVGIISNDPRLMISVPDFNNNNAPYALYIGNQVRIVTFSLLLVINNTAFTDPNLLSSGIVEIAADTGELNFSNFDLTAYQNQIILYQRQNFFSKSNTSGKIGSLPYNTVSDYFLFLNPKPNFNQLPRVRIGYQLYLTPIPVLDESLLGDPSSGSFSWAINTGRVRFSTIDVENNLGENIYYDGVTLGSVQFTRISIAANVGWPNSASAIASASAIGLTDSTRFIIFAEKSGESRRYWTIILKDFSTNPPGKKPSRGTVYLDTSTGNLYFNPIDATRFSTWQFYYIDSIIPIENGVSVQFYRSGANASGVASVPDFYVFYSVVNQYISNNLLQYPFTTLSTIPVVDSSFKATISQNPGATGFFTGDLVDGTKSNLLGLGYLLDLDNKQLSFSNRIIENFSLAKPTYGFVVSNPVISDKGLEIFINGNQEIPGIDFSLDTNTGLIEFLSPTGENNQNNISDISGNAFLPNIVKTYSSSISSLDVGKYIYIKTGLNFGLYKINLYINDLVNQPQLVLDSNLKNQEDILFDLKNEVDLIVYRVLTSLNQEYRKISVYKNDHQLSNTEFSVFEYAGQINLVTPAVIDDTYRVDYIVNGENKQYKAGFPVYQEIAVSTVGSSTVLFNSQAKTVINNQITVYVNGIRIDNYEFEAPSTLNLPVAIESGQTVVIDYFIEEANGGETSFNLPDSEIELDRAKIIKDLNYTEFNGNLTSLIQIGSPILYNENLVLLVSSVVYHNLTDTTTVTFTTPAKENSTGELLIAESVASVWEVESNQIGVFTRNTNNFTINGDQSIYYKAGTLITINDDPYYILNSIFDGNLTIITTTNAIKNYIIPTIKRTTCQIQFPTTNINTTKHANLNYPVSLIKMGNERKLLIKDLDYIISDGGIIILSNQLIYGDYLYALYTAKESKPIGTSIQINYAYSISPNEINGLLGQRLSLTYNLYAPDTFFFRIETYESFLPEVNDLLKSSTQSSYGPDVSSLSSLSNKDYGKASPYFEEQHYDNLDSVIIRILKFYNDYINLYEDILSNLDGRMIGGQSGRFRFDGNINNPVRSLYSFITNDIDDRVRLYDIKKLISFYTFQLTSVYQIIGLPHEMSRLFPISYTKSAAIGSNINSIFYGEVLGSLEVEKIKTVDKIVSAKANQFFTIDSNHTNIVSIIENGNEDELVPPFQIGQNVDVYQNNGSFVISTSIVDISGLSITLNDHLPIRSPLNELINSGSLLQNVSDSSNPLNHYYVNNRDLVVDVDNGQIINNNTNSTLQTPVIGSEILDFSIGIIDPGISPKRIPVLDGLLLNDDGRVPAPRLKRSNELDLIHEEIVSFVTLNLVKVDTSLTIIYGINIGLHLKPGNIVRFLNGPNNGHARTVDTIINQDSVTVELPFVSSDLTGSDLLTLSINGLMDNPRCISVVLNEEIKVLRMNNPHSSTPIPTIYSELTATKNLIYDSGSIIATGTGTTTVNTLIDLSKNFLALQVTNDCLIYKDYELYKIINVTDTELTIETVSPYYGFQTVGSFSYTIIRPESYLNMDQFGVLAQFIKQTQSFYDQTSNWYNSLSTAGKQNRYLSIINRISYLNGVIEELENTLIDTLYDIRYLWIQQRTDRKDGTLVQKLLATNRRIELISNIINNQKKLLTMEAL